MNLEEAMDGMDEARAEVEALETKRASLINDIDQIASHHEALLEQIRDTVLAQVHEKIANGAYDDAVTRRAAELNTSAAKAMHTEPPQTKKV
jgi:hypothetical protein